MNIFSSEIDRAILIFYKTESEFTAKRKDWSPLPDPASAGILRVKQQSFSVFFIGRNLIEASAGFQKLPSGLTLPQKEPDLDKAFFLIRTGSFQACIYNFSVY